MADHELLEVLRRELKELITAAERLAGRLRAMETVIERFG
jgi:hypothetical protein